MHLLLVSKVFYSVYAVAKSRERCELLEFLEELDQTLQKDSDRMLARKTPRGEIDHAIQLMDDYFEDKEKARIQIYGEEGV